MNYTNPVVLSFQKAALPVFKTAGAGKASLTWSKGYLLLHKEKSPASEA